MKVIKTAAMVVGAVALVATGVGAVVGGAAFLAATGVSLATVSMIGTVAGLVGTVANMISPPKPAKGTIGGSQTAFKLDPNAGIPYLMGRTYSGGNIFHRDSWGTDNQYQGFCVTYSGAGTLQAFESFKIDNSTVTLGAGGAAVGSYAGWLWSRLTLPVLAGAAALSSPVAGFPGMDANFKVSGHATAVEVYKFDVKNGKKWSAGVPKNGVVAIGERVYDPRQDSTYPGGSGPCRAGQEATYVGGAPAENPWLHALTWGIGRFQNGHRVLGVGQRIETIDVAAFVDAANVADANGWKLGGVVYSVDDKWDIMRQMAQAGGGQILRLGARLSCFVNAPKVSLATVTDDDLVARANVSGSQTYRDRLNGMIPKYRSEGHGWEMIPASVVRVASYVTADGEEKTREWPLPLVQQLTQAGQLTAYELVNRREFGPINLPLFLRFMGYKPGDALNLNINSLGLVVQQAIVRKRQIDPQGGSVQLSCISETPAKHPFALGTTSVAPPLPSLSVPDESVVAAPQASDWQAVGGELENDGVKTPAIILTGDVRNPIAEAFLVEVRAAASANWSEVGRYAARTTRVEILNVAAGGGYYVGVSFVRRGVIGERLQLGPVGAGQSVAGDALYEDGQSIHDLQPAEEGATEGAPAGTNVGGVRNPDGSTTGGIPAEQVPTKIGDLIISVDDLVEVYGDTVAAAASANAAATAAQNAETARAASVVARGAAEQARTDALAAATTAAGSASAASGSASTASTKATEAGQSATAAAGSATAAGTSAGNASTSAGQAATSATNASGSASSASTSATTAATAADNSAKAIADAYPEGIARGALTTAYQTFEGAALEPLSFFSGDGRTVLANTTTPGIYPYALWLRAPVALMPGRRYRVVAIIKKTAGAASSSIAPRIELFNAAKTWTASIGPLGQTPAGRTVLTGAVQQLAWEFTSDGYAAGTSWIRVGIDYNRDGAAAPIAGAVEVTALYLRDVTESAAAAGSASAAATSASSASGSATTAGQQATAAQTSATNANTSAGNASTSAGQASTSATGAAGSASSASTSAGAAATSYGATLTLNGNENFDNGTDGWTNTPAGTPMPAGQWNVVASAGGRSNVISSSTASGRNIWSIKKYPITAGRKYRLRAGVAIGSGAPSRVYIGVQCYTSAGVTVGTNDGLMYIGIGGTVYPADYGWSDVVSAVYASTGFPAGTAYVKLIAWLNYDNAATSSTVDYFAFEDVTESFDAGTSASAAAGSASSASTNAGAAGGSATAAQNSATAANTSAGNASSSATSASGSASSASGSASAALSSMQLAAVVGQRAINANPMFAEWPSAAALPTSWAQWGAGAVTKQAGLYPSPNAIGLNTSGGSVSMGVLQWMQAVKPGRYIVEVDFEILSGTMANIGIMWRGYNAANANITGPDFPLFNIPDVDGIVWGSTGTYAGRMYRFRVLVDEVATSTLTNAYVYFSTDQYFTGTATPKNVKLHRFAVVPADERDQLPAEVKALAGAVASAGRQTAFLQQTTSVAGGTGSAVLAMRADVSSPASAPVTPYLSGTGAARNTTFVGRRAFRNTGNADWDNGFYSYESYAAGAYAAARAAETSTAKMFGLSDSSPESATRVYSAIDYAIYITSGAGVQIYESGSPVAGVTVAYVPNDYFEVEYTAAAAGTVNYKKNGTTFLTRTGVGAARTFRLLVSMNTPGASLEDVVFAPAGPSTTSSITLLAREVALGNTDEGGNAKIALKLANGDAAFSGNIYAGGKIIMGNGNTGWEVAVKQKVFVVADGATVTWANLGYIPSYVFDTIGLAPLAAGETYALTLTSLSATGATCSLKINVPGTPVNQTVGPAAASGGGGNPAMVVSKAGKPDAANNAYRFQGSASASAVAYKDPPAWYADINLELTFYAKVGGTWTVVGYHSDFTTVYDPTVGGTKTHLFTFDQTVTIPTGATDFGMDVGGSAAPGSPPNGNIATVTWQSPGTAGSVRTASPAGQTCKLTVTP